MVQRGLKTEFVINTTPPRFLCPAALFAAVSAAVHGVVSRCVVFMWVYLLLQVKVPVTKKYLPLEKRLVQPVSGVAPSAPSVEVAPEGLAGLACVL